MVMKKEQKTSLWGRRNGFGFGNDLYGNDVTSSAKRVETWASTWNIGQLQPVDGPTVTV
jgi:hypothetical protein